MTAVEEFALALFDAEIDAALTAFEASWRKRLPARTAEGLVFRALVEATACRNRFVGALPQLAAECELVQRR